MAFFHETFCYAEVTCYIVKYVTLSHTRALVAQMVERKTLNLVVVGSIPTEGVFSFSERVRLLEARVPSKFSFSPLRSYGVMVST